MCYFRRAQIRADDIKEYLELLHDPAPDYDAHDIPVNDILDQFYFSFENGQEVELRICSGNRDEPIWIEGDLKGYGVQEYSSTNLAGYWDFDDNKGNHYLLHVSMI